MTVFFVGGCMRTGTAVLQAVLCSGEETNPALHEAQYVTQLVHLHLYGQAEFERRLCHYFDDRGAVQAYHAELLQGFLDRTLARYAPAAHLVLKHPEMTPLFPVVGGLVKDARFVVAVRDPRDTIASILDVAEKQAAQGGESLLTRIAGDANALARHVNGYYAPLFVEGASVLGDRLTFVRYEDLVTEPEGVVAALATFSGLALEGFDPAGGWRTEVDYGDEKLIREPFHSELRGRPLTAARIGRYAERLSDDDVTIIEKTCGGLMRAFRYEAAA